MSDVEGDVLDHPEVQVGKRKIKLIGYLLSVGLTTLSFALVYTHALPPETLEAVITLVAFILIGTQLFCFSNIDLAHIQRWNLAATILAIPLFFLMIGLTVWIFYMLQLRVSVPGLGH